MTEVVSFPFVEGGSLNFGILAFQVQLEHGLTNYCCIVPCTYHVIYCLDIVWLKYKKGVLR